MLANSRPCVARRQPARVPLGLCLWGVPPDGQVSGMAGPVLWVRLAAVGCRSRWHEVRDEMLHPGIHDARLDHSDPVAVIEGGR